MMQVIETNWLAFALVLAIGLLVAWWIFARSSKSARPRQYRPDVLDEGAAPAARNQALIDAPSAAAGVSPPASPIAPPISTPPQSVGMAGIGEVVSTAASDEVEAAVQDTVPAPAPAPSPPPAGEADDLLRIKGVGPKLVALLHGLGITRYSQIAEWSDADVERIDAQLGTFAGRIVRDSWIEQARYLAAGDVAGFEGRFGKL